MAMNKNFLKQPQEVFYNKSVLKNFAKFTEKHLCQSLLFNKVASLRLFAYEFLRKAFLQNTSWRMLLSFDCLLSYYSPLKTHEVRKKVRYVLHSFNSACSAFK